MKFRDIIELSFQRFRTRSLRFFLTITGVGIGVGVVFFLVTLGFGLQQIVIGRIVTGDSISTLTATLPDSAAGALAITNDSIGTLKQIEHVDDVSPLLSIPTEISYNDLKAQTLTQAVYPSYFRYAGISPTGGALFDDNATSDIVVSTTVFKLFNLNAADAIGKEVTLSFTFQKEGSTSDNPQVNIVNFGHPFKIVGYVEGDTNAIYVPLSVFKDITNPVYTEVRLHLDNVENIDPVRSTLISKGYNVIALTDTLNQLNQIFRVSQITLAVLGLIALLISSVGMFNTLTISLLERTQEVGILKAIGATNSDVWKIFLFEALLISTSGGIAGVVGGLVFAQVINVLINRVASHFGGTKVNIFAYPIWFIATIVVISIVIGFLTGLYPARRAAKLNPLEALRRE